MELYNYKGFQLLRQDSSLEAQRLQVFCLRYDIPLIRVTTKENNKDYVPCGSVEWCEQLLGKHVQPTMVNRRLGIYE